MLDPFVQIVSDEREKNIHGRTGTTIAEMYGHSIDTSTPHPSVGLWVGRLLIRMGEKLSGRSVPLSPQKEKA
jgi:hypothetical protein